METAAELGVSPASVRLWVRRWNAGGIPALRARARVTAAGTADWRKELRLSGFDAEAAGDSYVKIRRAESPWLSVVHDQESLVIRCPGCSAPAVDAEGGRS